MQIRNNMNKYYAIAMLAALQANQTNIDELVKLRKLTQKHEVGYNEKHLRDAELKVHAANDGLFDSIRTVLNDTASTNHELFEKVRVIAGR